MKRKEEIEIYFCPVIVGQQLPQSNICLASGRSEEVSVLPDQKITFL